MNGYNEEKSITEIFSGWKKWVCIAFILLIVGIVFMLSGWYTNTFFSGGKEVSYHVSASSILSQIRLKGADVYSGLPSLTNSVLSIGTGAAVILVISALFVFKKGSEKVFTIGYITSAVIAATSVIVALMMGSVLNMYLRGDITLNANLFVTIAAALAAIPFLRKASVEYDDEMSAAARYEAGANTVSSRYGRFDGQSVAGARKYVE